MVCPAILELADPLDPKRHPLVPSPELYKHLGQPIRVVLHRDSVCAQAEARGLQTLASCRICPTLASTASWNLPCICPIINSLSNLSVPANTNNLAVRALKNILESPSNHERQYGAVDRRGVRQITGGTTGEMGDRGCGSRCSGCSGGDVAWNSTV